MVGWADGRMGGWGGLFNRQPKYVQDLVHRTIYLWSLHVVDGLMGQ
mgnify:FL=1